MENVSDAVGEICPPESTAPTDAACLPGRRSRGTRTPSPIVAIGDRLSKVTMYLVAGPRLGASQQKYFWSNAALVRIWNHRPVAAAASTTAPMNSQVRLVRDIFIDAID